MSDPVRITNPGAESLGYDSDGHEIMAVDIYVNPPRVDVFHGTPPAWSSFGNKTIWGGNGVSLDIENYCTLRLLFNQSLVLDKVPEYGKPAKCCSP
ncbi:hypothetical protein E3175_27530 (plasmid) [Escherichia coli O55:H7]|nr:hypothetical protein E3158_27945 [Escherichia coli O55:H7]RCP33671.1 hypothetical protein A6581_24425 [Escherichia coli]QKQ93907.1 hypothetical protein E3175_27530 [Escherichia coli O55:H7]CTT28378.1 colicin protein [Escherichia coli]CTT37191.1 colicin protein [Escherichia coli]